MRLQTSEYVPAAGCLTAVALAGALTGGCVHHTPLLPKAWGGEPVPGWRGRKVALVLGPASVPSTVRSGSSLDPVVVRYIRPFFELSLRTALEDSGAATSVLFQPPPRSASYDTIVHVEDVEVEARFVFACRCSVQATIRVTDGVGRELLQRRGSADGPVAAGSKSCIQTCQGAVQSSVSSLVSDLGGVVG